MAHIKPMVGNEGRGRELKLEDPKTFQRFAPWILEKGMHPEYGAPTYEARAKNLDHSS